MNVGYNYFYFEVANACIDKDGAGSPNSKTYFCHDVVERYLLKISKTITFAVKGIG